MELFKGLTALEDLLIERCSQLSLTPQQLVGRCVCVGLKRLRKLLEGEFERSSALLAALPHALHVSPEVVARAVLTSWEQLQSAQSSKHFVQRLGPAHSIRRPTPQPLKTSFSEAAE